MKSLKFVKKQKTTSLSNKGVSFIELILALGIISLLAVIAVPRYKGFSRESKQKAVLSNLMYVQALFQLYRKQNGHYGGVHIPDEIKLSEDYCGILIFSTKNCDKPQPWHIQNSCAHSKLGYQSVNSGFVLTAYGERGKDLDISLNHKKDIFKVELFDASFKMTKEFKTELDKLKECKTYKEREECRSAGCRWSSSSCEDPPSTC